MPSIPLSMLEKLTEPVGEIKLDDIHFKSGSIAIAKSQQMELTKIAQMLSGLEVYLLIESYTDSIGTEQKNLILSQKRSKEAKKYLLEGGYLKPEQIIIKNYGENYSTSSSSLNSQRRISLIVLQHIKSSMNKEAIVTKLRDKGLKFYRFDIHQEKPTTVVQKKQIKEERWSPHLLNPGLKISIPFSFIKGLDFSTSIALSLNYTTSHWSDDYLYILEGQYSSSSYISNDELGSITEITLSPGIGKLIYKDPYLYTRHFITVDLLFMQVENNSPDPSTIEIAPVNIGASYTFALTARIPKTNIKPMFTLSGSLNSNMFKLNISLGASYNL